MKLSFKTDPTIDHRWFAWYPVLVLDRRGPQPVLCYIWLEHVLRKAVSVQGVTRWAYTPTIQLKDIKF